jgi:uncharacterized RDD family membrane protein YckC
MSDHYEELGVEPTASKDDIRDAHRARLAELEAARERKGVTDAQLQANRDEAALVRTAWNVLSDPMQRQRYDQQLMDERAGDGEDGDGESDVEIVDDDGSGGDVPAPTGWRKLLGPPPAKPAAAAAGAKGAAGRAPKPPSGKPNRPAPTVELPEGMELAPAKSRGMALLFDLAVCAVIAFFALNLLPGLIQSDYSDLSDKATKTQAVADAQGSLKDAQKSAKSAKSASDKKSAAKDVASAQKDLKSAEKDAKKAGVTDIDQLVAKGEKSVQARTDDYVSKTGGTNIIRLVALLVLVLGYLVPVTAITGQTFGMRNRKIKVVRVDGSRCGWYAATTRFAVPVLIAVALGQIGPIIGMGMVLWGYRDKNGQGVHDKLARTLVVTT